MHPDSASPWNDDDLIRMGIAFKGGALATSPFPFRLAPPQQETVAARASALCRAAEAVTRAFVAEPAIRALFGYGALQEQCILKNPGYRPQIPLGRFDSFLFPEGPRFMEFNTDGTATWHYTAALTALWRASHGRPPEQDALPDRLLRTLVACFRQWDRRGVDRPRIAIVDWADVGTRPEQEALAARFSALGCPCAVEDPRALRREAGRLVGPSGPVDLVYRRLVSEEAFRRPDEIRPFLEAYLEDAACFVGGFRTDPAWSKTLFVLLSDPAYARLFQPALREALGDCVPWTRPLSPGPVVWRGGTGDLRDLLLENPADFIVKPARSYEGRGAVSGGAARPESWRRAVDAGLREGGMVVQELLHPEPAEGLEPAAFLQVGIFVLLGRPAGFLARSSATPVIGPGARERYHPVDASLPWSP